jgi:hypothetical protein
VEQQRDISHEIERAENARAENGEHERKEEQRPKAELESMAVGNGGGADCGSIVHQGNLHALSSKQAEEKAPSACADVRDFTPSRGDIFLDSLFLIPTD